MDASIEGARSTSPARRRGFAELHRDAWRVIRSAPWIFIGLPAVLWLPFDVWVERVASARPADGFEQLRVALRLGALGNASVGTFASAVVLAALVDLAGGREPSVGRALREGLRLWGRLFGVFLWASLCVGVGFLLLVIPGLVLLVRYAVAQPAAAFERLRPAAALRTSAACVRGRAWSVLLTACAATLLYLPLLVVPGILVPGAADAWVPALAQLPVDVFFSSFAPIGLTLLYADLRGVPGLSAPVGFRPDPDELHGVRAQPSGRGGVGAAAAASAAAVTLAVVGFQSLVLAPISDGDEAWERQEYREALGHYERAIYWDPTDAYVHYSIGWCRLALDDLTESLRAFDAAIEFDSDNALYQLDRVRPLVRMGRFAQARFQLARASGLDGADPATVDALHGDLSEAALERVRRLLQAAELLDARSALAEARGLERIDGAAVEELEAALRAAFLQRAQLLMQVGRPADARVVLEQARGLEVDEGAVRELEARASEALLEAVRIERDAILLLREDSAGGGASGPP